jgi:hypothetical protein
VDPLDPLAGRPLAAGSAGKEDQVTDRNCCDGLCEQGRSCLYREACTLEDSPHPKRDVVFEVLCWVAAAVTVAALAVALGVVG